MSMALTSGTLGLSPSHPFPLAHLLSTLGQGPKEVAKCSTLTMHFPLAPVPRRRQYPLAERTGWFLGHLCIRMP